MRYFDIEDFNCPCCGANGMEEAFLSALDRARGLAGTSFVVNSGYRCKKHNDSVGGKLRSAHTTGYGADISATTSRKRYQIIDGLLAAGFSRIGIAKSFIHADNAPSLAPQVIWVYS